MDPDRVIQVTPQTVNVESGNGIYHFIFFVILLVLTPLSLINWTVDVLLIVFVLGALWRTSDFVSSFLGPAPHTPSEEGRAFYLAKTKCSRTSNGMKTSSRHNVPLPRVDDIRPRQYSTAETSCDFIVDEVQMLQKHCPLPSKVSTTPYDIFRPNNVTNLSPVEEEVLAAQLTQISSSMLSSHATTSSLSHSWFTEDLVELSPDNNTETTTGAPHVQLDASTPVFTPLSPPPIEEPSGETETSVSLVSEAFPTTTRSAYTDESPPRQGKVERVWDRMFHRKKHSRSLLAKPRNRKGDDVQERT